MAGNYTQVGNQTFQSTPLVRGTTESYHALGGNGTDFNPRPS